MLKRILKLVPRLLFLGAWMLVIAGVALLVLEESGVLTRFVRTKLAARLGPLGDALEIEQVRLRWFEPGIVAEGVTLRAPGSEAQGPPLVRLDSIHLSLHPDVASAQPARRVHVDGGRVRICDELFDSFDSLSSGMEEGGGGGFNWNLLRLRPPSFYVEDIEVDLELPDGEEVGLGHFSLAAIPEEADTYRVLGRLVPTFAGMVQSPPPTIHLEGRQNATTSHLVWQVRRMRVEALRESIPAYFGSFPVERFSGQLTATMESELDWGPNPSLTSSLRVAVDEASLLPQADMQAFEDLAIQLAASFDYVPGRRLWDQEAWSAQARIDGRWADSPLLGFGRFGRDAPPGDWARLWARLETLPLEIENFEGLGFDALLRENWEAFAPRGLVDATVDLTLPHSGARRQPPRWNPAVLAHVRCAGQGEMTYHGSRTSSGEREGFLMPCTDVRGDVLVSVREKSDRPMRVGFLDMRADHGSGELRMNGLLTSPRPDSGFVHDELEMNLHVPSMAIDDRLRVALEGTGGTRDIWPEWNPAGGTVSGTFRFEQSARVAGFTGSGEIDIHDTTIRWSELPVPMEGVDGQLLLAWGDYGLELRGADPPGRTRPFGIAYRFSNVTDDGSHDRSEASVAGVSRDRSWTAAELAEGVVEPDVFLTEEAVMDVAVDIPALRLRGADWDVLARTYPEIGETVDELGAKGTVAATYHGAQHSSDALYVSEVTVQPTRVEVTPERFRRRTKDLVGRMLIRMVENPETGADDTDVGLAVTGAWPQDVELAITGDVPPRGMARLDILGAGVDPTNTAFKGALAEVLAEDPDQGMAGNGLDATGGSIQGLLDFSSRTEFLAEVEDAEETGALRIHLRGNTLENGSLRLTDMRGIVEQTGNRFRSDRITATLVDHPLELRNVIYFPLSEVDAVDDADPLLRRPGFWTDRRGMALQAELHVDDLPVDEEHLSNLLEEDTLTLLKESATWSGHVDIHGARIVMTTEEDTEGKVAIRGVVEPHDLAMRLGVPIDVMRGRLDIRELIFESGRVRGWGQIEGLDARIADRTLSEARMIVGYVDGRLTIDNLRGDFEGGLLQSLGGTGSGSRKALGIDLSPPYRFDVAMRLDEVPLDRLLKGVFPSPIADQGIVNAGLHLSGVPGDVLDVTGSGWIRLKDGRLWSIPVMRELFRQIGFDQTAVFDRARVRFLLRDGVIETPDLEIKSHLVNLVGKGTLHLDGKLHYDLELHYSLIDKLAGPNRLIYWLNNILWRVAVRGDMARPVVRIRNALVELVRPFRVPPRGLPLPAFSDLPPRF